MVDDGLSPKRHVVLVVDDEPMIRLAIATHLEDCGFRIREAWHAASAIAVLQEPNCPVDLLFTDVRMPGELDGLGLARWVFENRPNIPVIIVSGKIGRSVALKDLCGAEALAKPYDFDLVVNKIRAAIKNRPPSSQ